MKISELERRAILDALKIGEQWGYGNLITHLQTAWARELTKGGVSEKVARLSARGPGMPFLMQDDLLQRGEWDETGARYRLEPRVDATRVVCECGHRFGDHSIERCLKKGCKCRARPRLSTPAP